MDYVNDLHLYPLFRRILITEPLHFHQRSIPNTAALPLIDAVLKPENILATTTKYPSSPGKEGPWFSDIHIMFIFSCYVHIWFKEVGNTMIPCMIHQPKAQET